MRGRLPQILRIAALGSAYVVVARLGLMVDAVASFATLVWPASGLALAALLLGGNRLWPGVFVGAFVTNLWTGAPVVIALGIALGNTLEALLGASLLRKMPGFRGSLERVRDVLGLIAVALGTTTVSATIGVLSLVAGGIVSVGSFSVPWKAWWMGDVLGDLVFAPMLLVWAVKPPPGLNMARRREGLVLATATVVASVLVYGRPASSVATGQAYLQFPLLIWAALRFGQRGAITATLACSIMAISGTALGLGPFVRPSLHQSLLVLQTFMGVTASTFLVLGASVLEKSKAMRDLRAAQQGLETKVEEGTAALSRANERLVLLKQLEEAVSARDALISIASHELRTPIAALQLQLHLINRHLKKNPEEATDPTKVLSAIGAIDRQVERLAKLIEHLLDVSRIAAGRLELELEDVDMAQVAREVATRFEAQLDRAKCELTLRADTPTVGRWDRMRLDQVVTNLLSNAVKYGAGKPIEIKVDGNDRAGRLEVRDQGMGIAPEDQARIFERFERVRSGREAEGFGLGLWIVRQVVDGMRGTIGVTSDVGAGATFVVELPRRAPAKGFRTSRPEAFPAHAESSGAAAKSTDWGARKTN